MNSNYKKNVIFKEAISKLAEDGALCSYDTRDYDEQGTALGGNSLRRQFKELNDRITNYHTLLEVLCGEKRANITEEIPVIDYIDKRNIGFSKHYTDSDFDTIDEIPSSQDSMVDMLIGGDKFFINRALLGQDQKLHFFNTTADIGSANNLLVSDCSKNNRELLYKGSKSAKYINTSGETAPKSFINTENLICVSVDKSNKNAKDYLDTFTDNDDVELYHYLIANVVPISEITEEDIYDIQLGFDEEADRYEDITYSFVNTYLNVDEHNKICCDTDYTLFLTELFGENLDIQGTKTVELKSGDIVFVMQAIPVSKEHNKIFIFRKFDEKYKVFSLIVEDFQFSSSLTIEEIPYNTYLTKEFEEDYIVSRISGYLNSSEDSTETTRVFTIPTITFLQRIFYIDEVYTAPASGLLLGKFCEPIIKEDSSILGMGVGKTTSKWKFLNQSSKYYKYHEDSNDYNIGTIFTNDNIFCRGVFKESPLKLTDKMLDNLEEDNKDGVIGYATYLYKKVMNHANVNSLMAGKFVNTTSSSWWQDTSNKPALDRVLSVEDAHFKSGAEAEKKGLNLIHIEKFRSLGRDFTSEDIDKALETWFKVPSYGIDRFGPLEDHWSGDKDRLRLYIDAKDLDTTVVEHDADVARFWFLFIPFTVKRDIPNYDKSMYLPGMLNDFNHLWQATYSTIKQTFLGIPLKTIYFNRLRLNVISPLEMFTRGCDTDTKTILVYPSSKNELPTKLYLISKEDLGLESGKVCSMWNPDKNGLVSFNIAKVHKFLPSKVREVLIVDNKSSKNDDVGDYVLVDRELDKWRFSFRDAGNSQGKFSIEHMKDKDCYVYVLEPVNLSVNDFTYIDTDDEEQSIANLSFDLKPMAYPPEYFKCLDSSGKLLLKNSESLKNLPGSIFLNGIPAKYDNNGVLETEENQTRDFYSNIIVNGRSLEIFYDFLFDAETGTISKISQRLLQNLLSEVLSSCSLIRSEK